MTQKFKTLAIDSGSELARLGFSWVIKKETGQYETIRGMKDYPGMTERLNQIIRRCKDFRDKHGLEVVIINHEGIDKIYAKGSTMTQGAEPAAIKGRIDIPGSQSPEELMRAADNIFRVRMFNGKPVWVANPESIPGADGAVWQVKDRFNAQKINAGLLPPSYSEIKKKAEELHLPFHPPYIWFIYGGVGFQKTRSLLTFPRPIKILDIDQGTSVIKDELTSEDMVISYNSENFHDWTRFMLDFESTVDDPLALSKMKSQLGVK